MMFAIGFTIYCLCLARAVVPRRRRITWFSRAIGTFSVPLKVNIDIYIMPM
jgi:hypothetical protein